MIRYPLHPIFLGLCMLSLSIACHRSPEASKAELLHRGYALDQRTFLANVRTNDVSVVRMFLDAGMSPNSEKGWPPLMVAASADRSGSMKLLLARGALIDATNASGESALCEAAARNMTNAALVLINAEANVSTASLYGWQAIHSAAKNGIAPVVKALLARSADVNATTVDGITPLMLAACYGRLDIARILIDRGARIPDRTKSGLTAYDFAVRYGFTAIGALLTQGADSNAAVYPTPMAASNGAFSAAALHTVENARLMRYAVIQYSPAQSDARIEVIIDASVGGRVVSVRIGGVEVIDDPKPIASSYMQITGMPILFPAPNRVTSGVYRMGTINHSMRISTERGARNIHGIAIDDAWAMRSLTADARSASASLVYAVDRNNPRFDAFPYPCTLTVTYTVTTNSFIIAYSLRNDGSVGFDFGFGVHPYFRVIGPASNVLVQCDATHVLAHSNFVPTGERIAVNGTADDIRSFTPLASMKNDNAMYPLRSRDDTRIRYTALGLDIAMRATDDFGFMVRYNPAGKGFIALEHQTSAPDAHNLHAKGMRDIARLVSVAPGMTKGGRIEYSFTRDK
ncbi:MAG: ankyrin repeat domain-containing protein [Spirochaetota bacterium]